VMSNLSSLVRGLSPIYVDRHGLLISIFKGINKIEVKKI
jgi:hypothetical protein